eukprot:9340920-Pyramimonas_sp.AAC.1
MTPTSLAFTASPADFGKIVATRISARQVSSTSSLEGAAVTNGMKPNGMNARSFVFTVTVMDFFQSTAS